MELGTLLQHLPPRLEVLRHLDQVLRGFRATGQRLERLVHVACGMLRDVFGTSGELYDHLA